MTGGEYCTVRRDWPITRESICRQILGETAVCLGHTDVACMGKGDYRGDGMSGHKAESVSLDDGYCKCREPSEET